MEIDEAYHKLLRAEADRLARERGLEADRVLAVFRRLMEPSPLMHPPLSTGSLERSFQCLRPDDALRLFEEEEDLGELLRRVALVDYLALELTPLFTLDELVDLTRDFAAHLERNREHLLLIGYPKTNFARSPFLDWHLTRLYFTKLPLALHRGRQPGAQASVKGTGEAERDERGNVVYSYTWAGETGQVRGGSGRTLMSPSGLISGLVGPHVARQHGSLLEPVVGSYEDAPLVPGLSPQGATRLKEIRPRLLDLRIAIVRRLSDAALTQSESHVEKECFTLLGEALTYDDAQFLLAMDAFHRRVRSPMDSGWLSAWIGGETMSSHNSGLSDLLKIIGHFEKEMAVGTMHRTALSLRSALRDAPISSYYEVVGSEARAAVDAALADFLRLEKREEVFLADYGARADRALETCLGEDVTVSLKVRRGQAAQLEPRLRSFADFNKAYADVTGKFPELPLSSPPEAPVVPRNTFRCDGAAWTVTFGGMTKTFGDTKGMRYMAFLLERRGEEFHVLELARQVGGVPPPDPTYSSMTARQLEEQGISPAGPTSQREIIDEKYRVDVEQKLEKLQERRDLAESMHDDGAVEVLQAQIDGYLRAVASTVGRGGRLRTFADEGERARQRVSKAIHTALRAIGTEHPELHAHLKASMLPVGYTVRYKPPTPVDWAF